VTDRLVRRPFGLPGGLYWFLGVFIALVLTAVPMVGGSLLLVVLTFTIVIWATEPKRAKAR